MRQLLLCACTLLSLFATAQNRFGIDWKNAPLNPASDYFTSNYFGLNGMVQSVTETTGSTKWGQKYDTSGFITTSILLNESSVEKIKYLYDWSKNLVSRHEEIGDIKRIFLFKLNAAKQMIQFNSYPDTNDTKRIYKYNGKGQMYEERSIDGSFIAPAIRYTYNNAGQLIEEMEYSSGAKIAAQTKYQYQTTNNQLTVSYTRASYITGTGKNFNYVEVWDENGFLIQETSPYSESRHSYTKDSKGNWISRTTVSRDIETNTTSTKETQREIIYY